MLILGHRGTGSKGENPENSLAAFEEALRDGADGVELDVRITADGRDLVISHPPAEKSESTLPRLRDVFTLMAAHKPPPLINIELKGPDTYALAQKQARDFCAQTNYPYERIIFSSFDHEQLKKLRQIDKDARIGVLFGPTYASVTRPLRLYPETDLPERRKPLTRRYMAAVMDTIKPTSLHAAAANFRKAKAIAAQYGLDLFMWASYGEGPPQQDRRVENIVRKEAGNPHIHVMTDYPAAMAKIRHQVIENKR